MKPVLRHSWKLAPDAAAALQRELAGKVAREPAFGSPADIGTVAALDVRYGDAKAKSAVAACVLFRVKDGTVEKTLTARVPDAGAAPYEPGLFSFREVPPLLKVLEKISDADLLLVNGHGLAHPRRFGLASHIGLIFDRPSVGCSDTPLLGDYDDPPPGVAGAYTILRDGDEPIGAALRSKVGSRPVFVSPGHRMDIVSAVDAVMALVRDGRLPEPLRLADLASRKK